MPPTIMPAGEIANSPEPPPILRIGRAAAIAFELVGVGVELIGKLAQRFGY